MGVGHDGSRKVEFPEVSKITEAGKQSVLRRILEYSILITGSQVGVIFHLQETFAMSEAIGVVTTWNMPVASSR